MISPICECPCGCSAVASGEHRSRGCVRQTCDACAGHIDAQDAPVVRCTRGHSGNRQYVWSTDGWWQCQGCGDLRSDAWIAERQAEVRQ